MNLSAILPKVFLKGNEMATAKGGKGGKGGKGEKGGKGGKGGKSC